MILYGPDTRRQSEDQVFHRLSSHHLPLTAAAGVPVARSSKLNLKGRGDRLGSTRAINTATEGPIYKPRGDPAGPALLALRVPGRVPVIVRSCQLLSPVDADRRNRDLGASCVAPCICPMAPVGTDFGRVANQAPARPASWCPRPRGPGQESGSGMGVSGYHTISLGTMLGVPSLISLIQHRPRLGLGLGLGVGPQGSRLAL